MSSKRTLPIFRSAVLAVALSGTAIGGFATTAGASTDDLCDVSSLACEIGMLPPGVDPLPLDPELPLGPNPEPTDPTDPGPIDPDLPLSGTPSDDDPGDGDPGDDAPEVEDSGVDAPIVASPNFTG